MGNSLRITTSLLGLSLLAEAPCAAQLPPAQPGPVAIAPIGGADLPSEAAATPGDIIVTGSKRARTLQDTPISVSVTTGEAIERSQVRDIIDLQTLVPSLRINQLQGSGAANFFIRGFGNGANNIGIEPSVGVFIDGVYRSRSAAAIGDLPDLERVEVLRGPQSTLFGKNASAGIVSVVTAAPKFDFGGHLEASYGNYNATVLKGSVTGPISRTLAVSLAGNYDKRDGYTRNLLLGTRSNDRNRFGLRAQALFEPSKDFKIRLIADYDKIDEVCCSETSVVDGPSGNVIRAIGGRTNANAPYSYDFFATREAVNRIENYGISAQVDARVRDGISVVAISSYRVSKSFANNDSDGSSADLIGSNLYDSKVKTFTQEVRVASDFSGPVNFLLGGFYFNERLTENEALFFGQDFKAYANGISGGAYSGLEPTLRALNPGLPAGAFGSAGQGRFNNFGLKDDAYSVFGQVDVKVAERLTATGGFNYTIDRKRAEQDNVSTDVFSSIDLIRTGVSAGVPAALAVDPRYNPFLALKAFQFLPPYLNYPNAVEDGKTGDDKLTYTLRLAYRFDKRFNVYATYATGFKASSFNLTSDSRPFAADFIPGSGVQLPTPASSPIRDAGLAVNNLTTGTRYAGPENAKVYEIGVKGSLPGFNFNLAIFRQVLTGFQSNIFFGTGFVLSNAEKESTQGVEIDATMSPVRNLTFTSSLTYLDAKYDKFTSGALLDPTTYVFTLADVSGRRVERTPKYTLTVGGTYTAELGGGHDAIFHVDYYHASPSVLVLGLPLKSYPESLNASVALVLEKGLELSIWGRNLTQPKYNTYLFPTVAQPGSLSGYPSPPRTYGVSTRYRF